MQLSVVWLVGGCVLVFPDPSIEYERQAKDVFQRVCRPRTLTDKMSILNYVMMEDSCVEYLSPHLDAVAPTSELTDAGRP